MSIPKFVNWFVKRSIKMGLFLFVIVNQVNTCKYSIYYSCTPKQVCGKCAHSIFFFRVPVIVNYNDASETFLRF